MTPTTLWLIAGVLFLAIEAIGVPGVGFLFAGLGALLVGALISLGMIADEAITMQWIVFFVASAVSALLLWKPLQRFHINRRSHSYSNMIGDTAYVGSQGLQKDKIGEVTWSGTIMRAELAKDAGAESLAAGSAVVIADVEGAKLIVRPKT